MMLFYMQYGEVVDVHLVRDKETGKSRGYCFLAYEDQRSTNLAVDNLSGSKVSERIIRVEHVKNFKKQKAEMEGEPMEDEDGSDAVRPSDVGDNRGGRGRGEGERENAGRDREPIKKSSANTEPWMQAGSYADLLREAEEIKRQKESASTRDDGRDRRKEHKKEHKKDKKDKDRKKDKKERERGRSRSRSRS